MYVTSIKSLVVLPHLTKGDSNQYPQLQRLARLLKLRLKQVYIDMKLSSKRITKALVSLCGCAGWSASLLFVKPRDRFCCN